MPGPIVNIAAYKFAPMGELQPLRADLRLRCEQLGVLGTILLAPEGINLFLAGSRQSIDAIVAHLRSLPGLADLHTKESFSDSVPFKKMLVKLKREIITFRQPAIDPARYTSARLSPEQLKDWLDAGKPVLLLDTRNDYEVAHGTFAAAKTLPLNDFVNFPKHLGDLPNDTPIVTFCTGGIRCEKAAPYLESLGLKNVYQLDGGILNYFEKVGGQHWAGACFVFDERVALRPDLSPISSPSRGMKPSQGNS